MIYLILAIASSAMISVFMRLSSHRIQNNIAMLVVNYLTCLVIAAVYTNRRLFSWTTSIPNALALGLFQGVLYLGGFVLFQYNVQKNGVVLSSLFMRLGLLVPLAVSMVLFSEIPTGFQIFGVVLAIAAIVVMSAGPKGRLAPALLLLLFASGSADAMSKIFEQWGDPGLSEHFLFYTFLAAAILCVGLMLLRRQRIGKQELIFGVLVGLPNFFSAKFLLAALTQLPGVLVYPTFSVGTILLVMLAGTVLFREKLTRRQAVAATIILCALLLLNISTGN